VCCTSELAAAAGRAASSTARAPNFARSACRTGWRVPSRRAHCSRSAASAPSSSRASPFLGKFGESLVEAYTRNMTDLERHWLERLQVIGKVQSRYLWILLITMIFYGALQERVYVDTDPLKIPIVDVEISGSFVLGFGPALISFFVLAITGTMRRPARRGRSSTLDAVTGAEKNSTPRPMHSTWPSTLPGSPQSLSRLLPTSATLHSWLSVSTRPRG